MTGPAESSSGRNSAAATCMGGLGMCDVLQGAVC